MILEKLHTKHEATVEYFFADGTALNERIGSEILLEFTGNIFLPKVHKIDEKILR